MADNRVAEAIEIIARRIVASEWDSAPNDLYLDDLELNDEDARAVVARAWSIAHDGNPDASTYEAAVDFLAQRAEDES